MPFPTPYPSFSGVPLEDVHGCNFTLSHGIEPSVAALTVRPLKVNPQEVGTLSFTMGNTRVVFPECRIEDIVMQPAGAGPRYWTLKILDRRWKWKFGEVSGHFNRRRADGGLDFQRTPQQLAAYLLRAEGEVNFDVSQLPNVIRPEVRWESANPMQELARLCDQCGCRIVLGLDNRVRLWRVGNGAALPVGGKAIKSAGQGFKKRVRPSSIKVLGGPVLYQTKLLLQAVGEEIDGSIVPINDLSYTPTLNNRRGWEESYEDFSEVTRTYMRDGRQLECRDLAQNTVFRWYQVLGQADRTRHVHGCPFVPNFMHQIRPLRDELLEYASDDQGIPRVIPAYVEGVYYTGGFSLANTVPGVKYSGEFSVDGERALVMFNEPVYRLVAVTLGATRVYTARYPADLYLTTSYSVKRNDNDMPLLTQREKNYGGNSGPEIIRMAEVQERFITTYNGNQFAGLIEFPFVGAAQRQLEDRIRIEESKYNVEPSADIEYSGYEAISPDGAIQQVTWNQVAGQTASTRASRNREHRLDLSGHDEKRRRQDQAWLNDVAAAKRIDLILAEDFAK